MNYQKLSEEERQVISREKLRKEEVKARELYVWEEGKVEGKAEYEIKELLGGE